MEWGKVRRVGKQTEAHTSPRERAALTSMLLQTDSLQTPALQAAASHTDCEDRLRSQKGSSPRIETLQMDGVTLGNKRLPPFLPRGPRMLKHPCPVSSAPTLGWKLQTEGWMLE